MRIIFSENNELFIDQDEQVLSKVEGVNLDGVDISDLRVGLDSLAKLYNQTEASDSKLNLEPFKRYAAMKAAVVEMFRLMSEKQVR